MGNANMHFHFTRHFGVMILTIVLSFTIIWSILCSLMMRSILDEVARSSRIDKGVKNMAI
jgi:hypothetical protein